MVFGQYEYAIIPLEYLVALPQVRKIKNAKLDELRESIAFRGLINPLDVARLSYSELDKHIKFLNELWKRNINIKSFTPIDGYYYVIISGHSRLEALIMNAHDNDRHDQVAVKIHKVSTSEEILAIQLDENIYAEPRLEERAIAIIETYRLGLINGKWKDRVEFIEQNCAKFSKRILNDALVFADLPLEVQEYVFAHNIFFATGVELGKLYPLIKRYENELESDAELLERNIKIHYAILLMKLQKNDSVKKTLSILSSHRKSLIDFFRPKEEVQQELFDFFEEGANRQGQARFQELLKEYQNATRALSGMPFDYFIKLFSLDGALTGADHGEYIGVIRELFGSFGDKLPKELHLKS